MSEKRPEQAQPREQTMDQTQPHITRFEYRRHLPHLISPGYPIFLTWNLKGAYPKHVFAEHESLSHQLASERPRAGETPSQRRIRHAKILFAQRDQALDSLAAAAVRAFGIGDSHVTDCAGARLESLECAESYDNVRLESLTYDGCPIWLADPRAAAVVVRSFLWGVGKRYALWAWVVMGNHVHVLLTPSVDLSRITQGIKGWTAHEINRLHGLRGRTVWQDESYDHWTRDEGEFYRVIEYIENNPVTAGLVRIPENWKWSSAYWRDRVAWPPGESLRDDQVIEINRLLERGNRTTNEVL